jgi:hypothetical protein
LNRPIARWNQPRRDALVPRPKPENRIMSKLDQDDRDDLADSRFAFPKERKEPIEDAAHVRNAIARFNQVKGVSDDERDAAWKRILAAARKFGVEVEEKSWREIGKD